MKDKKNFNSLPEYIYYLATEKNILSTKNIVIFISIIGMIAFISIEMLGNNKEKANPYIGEEFTYEYMIEVLNNNGYTMSELNEMTEDRISELFNEIYYSSKGQSTGNSKHKEYPVSESQILKQDYYRMASTGNFKAIINDFEDKKLEYSFSEFHNKELITIYNDAYYLNTIINQDSEPSSYLISQVLSNIKDSQMLLYGILLSPEESRRDIIKDKVSLSPILANKKIRVNSVKSGSLVSSQNSAEFKDDYRFKEIARYLTEGDFIIYKFDFTIDGNNLVAYSYKDILESKTTFYGIYYPPLSNCNDYLTIMDWINMDNDLNNVNTEPEINYNPVEDESELEGENGEGYEYTIEDFQEVRGDAETSNNSSDSTTNNNDEDDF